MICLRNGLHGKTIPLNVYKQNQSMHINSQLCFYLFELGLREGEDYPTSSPKLDLETKTDLSVI